MQVTFMLSKCSKQKYPLHHKQYPLGKGIALDITTGDAAFTIGLEQSWKLHFSDDTNAPRNAYISMCSTDSAPT
jgi:hypothetical protein